MSVSVVLSQFDTLVARIESLGSKLRTKRIRPTRDQLNQFQNLNRKLRVGLMELDTSIQALLAIGAPDDEDIRLAASIRSAKYLGTITSPMLTALKRNLELIFTGPKTSNFNSRQVKTRNKQTEMRCEALRSRHWHVILMWAIVLQPSTWKTSAGMTDKTFEFLIDDLEDERIEKISPQVAEVLQSLATEEPMCTSDSFNIFVEYVLKSSLAQDKAEIQRPTKWTPATETQASFTECNAASFGQSDNSERRLNLADDSLHLRKHAARNIPKIWQARRKR